ncbi:UDP-glucose/GDP-mannose dehydrogenase family protein [Nocardioides mangrovicus]|uniref:UDP-glucose 6-dehydrogenase n=1 Tax=Nocardioides mangrovicus TaxID=2478913 RepID=A0A3L8P402_9ACTN|nr:UDP-glucose/GDP-mannose dehydrogenase family protein [Nocardioides mangrovicus]RLV49831.1 UDP-glucose/GDP-mannose dehydrogenase family protein [Nocardioides mangrovicus]
MKLSVIGTGYLGATHAAAMVALGHDVVGLDVDADKVASLSRGEVPFHEPGLPELLREGLASGRLRFTTDVTDVGASADVHFLCVGTPQKPGEKAADLTYVEAAIAALLPELRAGALVVGKSTVPVGTAAGLAERVEAVDADLVWNPEFLREGFAVDDTLRPDRIVVGATSERAEKTLLEVYASLVEAGTPVVSMDYATAELVKVAANAFLATKISFINAMAEVCEAVDADVTLLADAIGHDERIGRRFLSAGLGFGGGCLPKDIRAFMARAGELGIDQALTFLKSIDDINVRRRARTVDLAREMCGGSLAGQRVAVLGAAFKPDSDDIRDSPALDVALACQRAGAAVRVYDPHAMDNARRDYATLAYAASAVEAATDADVVLHLTEWEEFVTMHPSTLSAVVRQRHIVDGRNKLDRELWTREGWTHRALGRRSL